MDEFGTQNAYPQPGEIIDEKYEISRELGTGGMGAVLEATHLLRKARVALKFMSPSVAGVPGLVDRFLNEGVVASRINNEHVVAVLDVSRLPSGLPYLVMEYLEGEDLRQLLAREGAPGLSDTARAVHFVLQVLRGLQAAHHVGIVHRDLKPANCFVVEKDGEPDFIKLVDFGISKAQEGESLNLTQAGSALGTPLYVSPEQARNPTDVDARTDLYSVAVILYELLAGHTPFAPQSGNLMDLFMQLATADPPPLDEVAPHVPRALAAVVARGLAKAPENRFQSCAELAAELAPFADARSELVMKQLLSRPSANPARLTPAPPRLASLGVLPRMAATAAAERQTPWRGGAARAHSSTSTASDGSTLRGIPERASLTPSNDAAASGARPVRVGASDTLNVAQLTPALEPVSSAPPATRCTALALWGCAGIVLAAVTLGWLFARAVPAAHEPERKYESADVPTPAAAPSVPAPGIRPVAEPPVSEAEPAREPTSHGGAPPAVSAGGAATEAAPLPDAPPTTSPARPEAQPRRKVPALKQIRIED